MALTGINSFHDFIIATGPSLVTLKVRGQCYQELYEVATVRKSGFDKASYCRPVSYESNPPSLTDQKLQQLKEQYDRYIKADIAGHIRPAFLVLSETVNPLLSAPSVNKTKRSCPQCDGSGHIQPGKKRHYVERYCPFSAKRKK